MNRERGTQARDFVRNDGGSFLVVIAETLEGGKQQWKAGFQKPWPSRTSLRSLSDRRAGGVRYLTR
jgi:hypothetical protein